MRSARSRIGKDFSFEERLEKCSRAVEQDAYEMRGSWKYWLPKEEREAGKKLDKPYEEVRLDLGCGKGRFIVESAKRNPDILFIGIDTEELCTLRGAELACAKGVSNAVFILDREPDLTDMFEPGEIDMMYLLFPTPFPKKKHAERRTVHSSHVSTYRKILRRGAQVYFETDSLPLYEYTGIQFDLAGLDIMWKRDDVQEERPTYINSEYKLRLIEKGATIYAISAVNGIAPIPSEHEIMHREPQSLIPYLPENLDAMDYIPHGMEGCVINMRNRRRNEEEKQRRHAEKGL